MTEQQYRIIAEDDAGLDAVQAAAVRQPGERWHWDAGAGGSLRLVSIERPVPTTDEPDAEHAEVYRQGWIAGHATPHLPGVAGDRCPHPPSREQIAEAIYRANGELAGPDWDRVASSVKDRYRRLADAVLALIQNGADR